MPASHIEFLVEEPSAEAFLTALLPRMLPQECTYAIHPFQCKDDLLGQLEARLRAYAKWLPDDWIIVIVVDQDDDDCRALKHRMDDAASNAGLPSSSQRKTGTRKVINRIAIEELEAWYFGDWEAVCIAYPRVPRDVPRRRNYRDPDSISGGTWEAFERILSKVSYFQTGLRKIEAARVIGAHMDPARSISRSFKAFCQAITVGIS